MFAALGAGAVLSFQNCNQSFQPLASTPATANSSPSGSGTTSTSSTSSDSSNPLSTIIGLLPTGSSTGSGSGDAQYVTLLTQIFAGLDVLSYLGDLGVSSSDIGAISPSALTNGTATPASITAAANDVISAIDSHSTEISLLPSTEKSTALQQVNSAISQLQAFDTTTLSATDQTSQQEMIAVLNELKKYL